RHTRFKCDWSSDVCSSDLGYSPAKAAANAQKLLADGADVLFGFVGTASSVAGAEVAAKEGAIFFAPFAASDTLRDSRHTNVFHEIGRASCRERNAHGVDPD